MIELTEANGKAFMILKGRFDFNTRLEFGTALTRVFSAGIPNLEIDLSEIKFVDSSGLSMLLTARHSCDSAGGSVVLKEPRDYVDKVLRLCKFDQLFRIERSSDTPVVSAVTKIHVQIPNC